tara:strand:+ start:359 stop:580 length:222 start_codon:yes stop_codon:yes gene_type:complete
MYDSISQQPMEFKMREFSHMTIDQARKILGQQPVWAIRNMKRALSLHQWLNTAAENQRLAAAKVILSQPKTKK